MSNFDVKMLAIYHHYLVAVDNIYIPLDTSSKNQLQNDLLDVNMKNAYMYINKYIPVFYFCPIFLFTEFSLWAYMFYICGINYNIVFVVWSFIVCCLQG